MNTTLLEFSIGVLIGSVAGTYLWHRSEWDDLRQRLRDWWRELHRRGGGQ